MPTRLPPLASLQAFEAAVRHQSYTRAAQELALTHGAISHHIATLEERLGLRLFARAGNRMVPTEHGRLLVVKVRQAIALLERGFERAGQTERLSLTLSVLSAFASRWLVPRLSGFIEQQPQIDICLDVRSGVADLAAGEADAAIRYGAGGWPDVQQLRLMGDEQFPVCAPHYRGGALPSSVAELTAATLLRNPWVPWEPWLHAAGAEIREPRHGPVFTDSAVLLDAAAAGLGIALARRVYAEEDLRSGRLVRLLDIGIPDASSYFFVWRADHPQIDAIEALRDWLLAQVAER